MNNLMNNLMNKFKNYTNYKNIKYISLISSALLATYLHIPKNNMNDVIKLSNCSNTLYILKSNGELYNVNTNSRTEKPYLLLKNKNIKSINIIGDNNDDNYCYYNNDSLLMVTTDEYTYTFNIHEIKYDFNGIDYSYTKQYIIFKNKIKKIIDNTPTTYTINNIILQDNKILLDHSDGCGQKHDLFGSYYKYKYFYQKLFIYKL
jgi:hypothetical protein